MKLARGAFILVASGMAARRLPPSELEVAVFRRINDLPDGLFVPIWAVMQGGSFGVVPIAAGAALLGGKRRLALSLAVSGSAAYVLAKVAKRPVGRSRPARILDGVRLRGREEGDLGFPSGHAAVSSALAAASSPWLDPRWGRAAVALAFAVGLSRLYVGAHLPLDDVGGTALGAATGVGVALLLRRTQRHRSGDPAS